MPAARSIPDDLVYLTAGEFINHDVAGWLQARDIAHRSPRGRTRSCVPPISRVESKTTRKNMYHIGAG